MNAWSTPKMSRAWKGDQIVCVAASITTRSATTAPAATPASDGNADCGTRLATQPYAISSTVQTTGNPCETYASASNAAAAASPTGFQSHAAAIAKKHRPRLK